MPCCFIMTLLQQAARVKNTLVQKHPHTCTTADDTKSRHLRKHGLLAPMSCKCPPIWTQNMSSYVNN